MEAVHVLEWHLAHQESFIPPICNKLMYKGQLSVMFVGGPNTREDFHVEEGSELFWQIKGNMSLPTIQNGELKVVHINEGQIFILPSRVPHSPQRPESGSLGLVLERKREPGELDCLRWYTDSKICDRVLWQKSFACNDLGKDLVPVVKEYLSSQEFKTKIPGENQVVANPQISVPDPINVNEWLISNQEALNLMNSRIHLFPEDHPDQEFKLFLQGQSDGSTWNEASTLELETSVFQLKGVCILNIDNRCFTLEQGTTCVIPAASKFKFIRERDSVSMVIEQNPAGNKRNKF